MLCCFLQSCCTSFFSPQAVAATALDIVCRWFVDSHASRRRSRSQIFLYPTFWVLGKNLMTFVLVLSKPHMHPPCVRTGVYSYLALIESRQSLPLGGWRIILTRWLRIMRQRMWNIRFVYYVLCIEHNSSSSFRCYNISQNVTRKDTPLYNHYRRTQLIRISTNNWRHHYVNAHVTRPKMIVLRTFRCRFIYISAVPTYLTRSQRPVLVREWWTTHLDFYAKG